MLNKKNANPVTPCLPLIVRGRGTAIAVEGDSCTTLCSTGDTKANPVTVAPSPGRSWAIALRIGPKKYEKDLMPLSSVACGATSFQWK